MVLTESLLKIRLIASENAGATDNIVTFESAFISGDTLIVSRTTYSVISESLILAAAGPENTPCVQHA